MAKKKAAKKKTKPQAVTLRFISDPNHGWLEVPKALLKKLGMSTNYASCGDYCYLEEDCEAADFERAANRNGVTITYAEHEVDEFDSWAGGPCWPYIAAHIYGDDANLVSHALACLGTQMKQCHLDETYSASERKTFREMWEDCMRLEITFNTMNGVK